MKQKRVLITAPLQQNVKIFREYQNALDRLIVPEGVTVDYHFVVNDCPDVIPEIRGTYEVINTGDAYVKTWNDHIWTMANLSKMSILRNATIKAALDGKYDYWWSIDTDIIVQPETLVTLLDADKDIISEVFWTKSKVGNWWCNGWMYDQADADGRLPEFRNPGLYQVGMTGALTLVKTDVFRKGVNYSPIPNIRKVLWGEDRWFCIRAACLGFEMWLDTHYPAEHLFTDNLYHEYMARREKNG